MTRDEAIKGLKALAKEFSGYKPNEEMFDMAIKALEETHDKRIVKFQKENGVNVDNDMVFPGKLARKILEETHDKGFTCPENRKCMCFQCDSKDCEHWTAEIPNIPEYHMNGELVETHDKRTENARRVFIDRDAFIEEIEKKQDDPWFWGTAGGQKKTMFTLSLRLTEALA